MLDTTVYTLEDLLRERREGAVRALIRAVGYALSRGASAEQVGRFVFDSYRQSGEYKRQQLIWGAGNAPAYAARHMLDRWAWCDDVHVREQEGCLAVESLSMMKDQDGVMKFHGVSRPDMEACIETLVRLSAQEMGLEATYTLADERDLMVVRRPGRPLEGMEGVEEPWLTPESLAAHRRVALAAGISASIGYAKSTGAEPEDLGYYFYKVWEGSGHYDRFQERFGKGNALAYAQSLAQARQVLYTSTALVEDLDGFTISSPNWSLEIPSIMGAYGVLPDDVYRYFTGGGVAACAKLGLQYADQSDDRIHRVWIRAR